MADKFELNMVELKKLVTCYGKLCSYEQKRCDCRKAALPKQLVPLCIHVVTDIKHESEDEEKVKEDLCPHCGCHCKNEGPSKTMPSLKLKLRAKEDQAYWCTKVAFPCDCGK